MKKITADTNVLVRLIVQDDKTQVEKARRLFLGEYEIIIPSTVFLELEWVLRSVLRFDRERIGRAFAQILALGTVVLPEEDRVRNAIDWHAAGMDFADALHLAGSSDCDELVTFDRDFARRAQDAPDAIPVRLL